MILCRTGLRGCNSKCEENLARPRCDSFEASAIRLAIKQGLTNERAAYLDYAASAARPYARSTFSIMLRRDAKPIPKVAPMTAAVTARWRARSLA